MTVVDRQVALDRLSGLYPGRPTQSNYLINWSERYRYIYVEVPKTGCTTVKKMLQLAEYDGDETRLVKNIHDRVASPLLCPLDNIDVFEEALRSEAYLVFTFVRNPYARTLSAYLDKIVKNQWERNRRLPALGFAPDAEVSLEEFLGAICRDDPIDSDIHWAPQTMLLGLPDRAYDYVGRFESFGQDLRKVAARLGMEEHYEQVHQDRPHETGASNLVAEYYDAGTKAIIEERFADDFTLLGYGRGLAPI